MYPALCPDSLRFSDLEQRFVCKVCGHRGATVAQDVLRRKGLRPKQLRGANTAPLGSSGDLCASNHQIEGLRVEVQLERVGVVDGNAGHRNPQGLVEDRIIDDGNVLKKTQPSADGEANGGLVVERCVRCHEEREINRIVLVRPVQGRGVADNGKVVAHLEVKGLVILEYQCAVELQRVEYEIL